MQRLIVYSDSDGSGVDFYIWLQCVSVRLCAAWGDSKRPLYFVLIACITNVILDLVLVAGLKMGALGAAIATVFSQAVSMITC